MHPVRATHRSLRPRALLRAPTLLVAGIAVLLSLAGALAWAEDPPSLLLRWGRHGSGDGEFSAVFGIAVSADGFVYVADRDNHRVQKFTSDSVFVLKWGSFGSGPGQFNYPIGVTVDPTGNVYVCDFQRIQKYDPSGNFILSWSGLVGPDIAADPTGAFIYALSGGDSVIKFTVTGERVLGWEVPVSHDSSPSFVTGLGVGPSGHVYVTVRRDGIIHKYVDDTHILSWRGAGDGTLLLPVGVTVDVDDNVYVADIGDSFIRKYTSSGAYLTRWGGFGGGPGKFGSPYYVAVDADKNVYVTDGTLDRIQKFGPVVTPTVRTTWGRIKSLYRR